MFITDSFFNYITLEQKDRDITAWADIYNTLFKKIKNKNHSYHGTFLYVADNNGELITGITHNPHDLLHKYLIKNSIRLITKKLWPINNQDYLRYILHSCKETDNAYLYTNNIKYKDIIFNVTSLQLNNIIKFYDSTIFNSLNIVIDTNNVNSLLEDRRILTSYQNIDYDILYSMIT